MTDVQIHADGQLHRLQEGWNDGWRTNLIIAFVLAALAATLVLLSIANAPRLSLFDESTHIDYAFRAGHFELPYTGQVFSPETLEEWSCRGQSNTPLPPCGSNAPPNDYPNGPVQYNAFHPPVYYFITGVSARVIASITGLGFVAAARSIGAVWLWASLFGLHITLRYWGVKLRYSLAAAAVLPLVPIVLHASSTVTNDAPAVLCGVAALFLLGRVMVHRNTGWILPALFAGVAASTKVMNALPFLVIAGVLVLIALRGGKRNGWKSTIPLVRIAGVMVLVVAAIHLGWGALQSSRTPDGYVNPIEGISAKPITGLPFSEWAQPAVRGTSLADSYYLDPAVSSSFISAWATVLNLLLAVGPFVVLAIYRRESPRWVVGGTVLLGMYTYPMLVQLQVLQGSYSHFPRITARYGMTIIPLAVASLALVAERKHLHRAAVALPVVGLIVVLATTAGVFA